MCLDLQGGGNSAWPIGSTVKTLSVGQQTTPEQLKKVGSQSLPAQACCHGQNPGGTVYLASGLSTAPCLQESWLVCVELGTGRAELVT